MNDQIIHQYSCEKTAPLLINFKTKNYFYIFDAPTNEILRVSYELWSATHNPLFWRLINDNIEINYSDVASNFPKITKDNLGEIQRLKKSRGVFDISKPKSLSLYFNSNQYVKNLRSKIGQLTLCMSERCNFRCTYCIYSGNYQNQRWHSNKMLSYETACTAVDFYMKNSYEMKNKFIGFYGGEPTLNFSTIKRVIKYIDHNFKDKKISYTITTNGYNLPDETLRFFIFNKFNILVSIDGSDEIHNRFRKLRNGRNTFRNVYSTLCRLKEMDSKYFETNVRFSVVIGPPYNIKMVKNYFDFDPLFKNAKFNVSGISSEHTNFFNNAEVNAANKNQVPMDSGYNAMRNEYMQNLINAVPYKSSFLSALFSTNFVRFYKRRLHSCYSDKIPANGACSPGIRKIFVSEKGKIYACEKVNSTIEIGDIYSGFYDDKIIEIMDKYINDSNQNCLSCFANRNCYACFAKCFSSSGFHKENKDELCDKTRKDFISTITDYCKILENNPNAFEFAKNIVYL